MADDQVLFNNDKMQQSYDALFNRAIAGDQEALASLKVMVQHSSHVKKYNIVEDIRSAEIVQEAPSSLKSNLVDFINKLRGR